MSAPDFPALLQSFFTDRLVKQRRASPHTVTAYRNTFRLFLRCAAARLGREPSRLEFTDLDTTFISEFLDHLERERSNSARSRNARLAALHAFFRYVAFAAPAQALLCQRVLAIPSKRFERGIVDFLNEVETEALLDAPDHSTWIRQARPGAPSRCHPNRAARLRIDRPPPQGRDIRRGCSPPVLREGP